MVCKVRNLLKKLKKFSLLRIFENTVFKVTAHRAHRGSTVIKKLTATPTVRSGLSSWYMRKKTYFLPAQCTVHCTPSPFLILSLYNSTHKDVDSLTLLENLTDDDNA